MPLTSGVPGPGKKHTMPKGSGKGKKITLPNGKVVDLESAVNSVVTHCEGHAAGNMITCGKTDSTVHINNSSGPCPLCQGTIPHLLPKGHKLTVCYIDDKGKDKCVIITGVK